jgi:2-keto-4-pentenoate hydratase
MDHANAIAEKILAAYKTRTPIAPVRSRINGVQQAYAVQTVCVNTWRQEGRKIAGRKIGLTSKAVQAQLGVNEPDFGVLFSDMIYRDAATIPTLGVMQPRVEAEMAFVLKSDISGDSVDEAKIVSATDYICPALEIVGSRIEGWNISIEDTIADNASSALVVLGNGRIKPKLDELASIEMKMQHNDSNATSGTGAACLGNPATAVVWLARALHRFGESLKAGDVVMSGALAKMIPARPGDRFVAQFSRGGSVSTQFDR